jgi:hypothetical protein
MGRTDPHESFSAEYVRGVQTVSQAGRLVNKFYAWGLDYFTHGCSFYKSRLVSYKKWYNESDKLRSSGKFCDMFSLTFILFSTEISVDCQV